MTKHYRFLFLAVVILLASCKKKYDDYYERPSSLEPPIYQQLESRGKFTKLLALINKAGYSQTLGAAGYWTMFAPTDSAFAADAELPVFLQQNNVASLETIDSATARKIVQYLLIYNGFEKTRIDDYQSSLGWVPDAAFKRRTAYYTGFYNDTMSNGQVVKAIASNRNNAGGTTYYNSSDNNNKYIPIFTSEFFSAKGLTAADYNFFYPGSNFSGFNVVNARVMEKDIAAENGVIHVIDKVVTPLLSLDEFLRTRPEYSEFRKLYERFMVLFLQNQDATNRYRVLSGTSADVFVKVYSNMLAFSPNNENHFKLQDNDGQRDGWTLLVPKNDSLTSYVNRVLLEHYPAGVNSLPLQVIADLLNGHMWQTTVWPSRLNNTFNFLGEPSYSNSGNIFERKILSNGIFYGTDKVNEPNVFSTVYGKAYLNPKYSIMTRLLDMDLRQLVTNSSGKFTMFMMSDQVLAAQGYSYNQAANAWTFNNVSNDSNRLNLLRILNSGVVETPNGELDNIGQPGFQATVMTYGGEAIRINGNQVITAGTRDKNITVTIDSVKTAKNGRVVYLSNLLYFTYQSIGRHLEILGSPTTSEYNLFWNYLKNSTAYDAVSGNIVGTSAGSFYTVLAPNNNAIRQAIAAGLLPGTPTAPLFTPTTTADKVKVEKFIQYHMIDKKTVIDDKKDIGGFSTLLKDVNGDAVTVNIDYPLNVFTVTDIFGRKAQLVPSQSNNLSNRTTIHLINNYLRYN